MSLDAELTAWCKSYVRAFADYDAAKISAHWTFPAVTTQAGRSFAFKSTEHFTGNTSHLLDFYRAQSVAQVERRLVSCQYLHKDAASMIVSDAMFTEDGTEIANFANNNNRVSSLNLYPVYDEGNASYYIDDIAWTYTDPYPAYDIASISSTTDGVVDSLDVQ